MAVVLKTLKTFLGFDDEEEEEYNSDNGSIWQHCKT
jgi:hypothetical protein